MPELTWRGAFTDESARRVLKLAADGHIDVEAFRMFAFGGVIRSISAQVFDS